MRTLLVCTGLFDRKVAYEVKYHPPIKPYDPVLMFYKFCQKWKVEVKRNPKSLLERKLFETSLVFKNEVIKRLEDLLTQNLSLDQIEAIWVACTFGQAWHPHKLCPHGVGCSKKIKLI